MSLHWRDRFMSVLAARPRPAAKLGSFTGATRIARRSPQRLPLGPADSIEPLDGRITPPAPHDLHARAGAFCHPLMLSRWPPAEQRRSTRTRTWFCGREPLPHPGGLDRKALCAPWSDRTRLGEQMLI